MMADCGLFPRYDQPRHCENRYDHIRRARQHKPLEIRASQGPRHRRDRTDLYLGCRGRQDLRLGLGLLHRRSIFAQAAIATAATTSGFVTDSSANTFFGYLVFCTILWFTVLAIARVKGLDEIRWLAWTFVLGIIPLPFLIFACRPKAPAHPIRRKSRARYWVEAIFPTRLPSAGTARATCDSLRHKSAVKPEEEEELKRLQLDDLRTKKNRRDVAAGCGGFPCSQPF